MYSVKSCKDICDGCLANDRKILPIQQYVDIYYTLIGNSLYDRASEYATSSKIPHMCWECRSYLRNTKIFQDRAKQANEILMNLTNPEGSIGHFTLSTLTTTVSTEPNYKMSYDEPQLSECKIEIQGDTKTDDNEYEEFNYEFQLDDMNMKDENDLTYYEDVEDSCNTDDRVKEETIDLSGVKEEVYAETIRTTEKRIVKRKAKFKFVDSKLNGRNKRLYMIKRIDESEMQQCQEKARESTTYTKATMKCEKCIKGFTSKSLFNKHLKNHQTLTKKYECHICGYRIASKRALKTHVNSHSFKYVCVLCGYECLKKLGMTHHLNAAHQQGPAVECLECGLVFTYREVSKHYEEMHRTFICDYCGLKTSLKKRLINHIITRHGSNICKYCNKKYQRYDTLKNHIELRHTKQATEDAYCVECDRQFDNLRQYKAHLTISVKHKRKVYDKRIFENIHIELRHTKQATEDAFSFECDRQLDNLRQYKAHLTISVKHKRKVYYPCPACDKVYMKNITMKNHYNLVHLQKTEFYCEKCSKGFVNSFALRGHIRSVHNKIKPPRDKICVHCGRGFSSNKTLDNHIRTHTGERPFLCPYCSSTFAQKSALVAHARAVHKTRVRYNEVKRIDTGIAAAS